MEINFKETMAGKSDEYLTEYIANRMKYMPVAVEAAIDELKTRGVTFTDEEYAIINSDLLKRSEEINRQNQTSENWAIKDNIVADESAPLYYSKRAFYGFSVFFTMLAGAFLLSANLKTNGKKKESTQVIVIGILYLILEVVTISKIGANRGLAFFFNGLGAYALEQLFWNKYLGKDSVYRARSITKPLIIWIVISAFFLLLALLPLMLE